MGALTMEGMERARLKVWGLNRVLCWLLPAAALGAGADLYASNARLGLPLQPLAPALEDLAQPLPAVGAAGFSADRFEQPVESAPAQAAVKPKTEVQVAAQEAQWKLRGVVMGGNKRAFLEDPAGKSVWVTEGERVGSARIKEIRERSIVMEGESGDYEIRL